jgi:citrate lyase beta subunit
MARLTEAVFAELDRRLAPVDAALRDRYPGEHPGRQPIHTVYVPADRFDAHLVPRWGAEALSTVEAHAPVPEDLDVTPEVYARVLDKLRREPIEDLRIDFEDGYGDRPDEDDAARSAAAAIDASLPFVGIRIKSLEPGTRRRAVRTLDVFLDALDHLPANFVVTLPKVSLPEQVAAMVAVCERLETAYGLASGRLRFEVQIEVPQAVLAADGTATVARMIHAAEGRCIGLHYGTYDYSAACGIAPGWQSMDHPVADHAKAVMQVAAAGTGVRLSDGSTNVLPIGDRTSVLAAWRLHARLVRRSLERGYYQGWDLHPAQLPTRYAATYLFFHEGLARAATIDLDEPAAARALDSFLRRGIECGALDP